MTRYRGYGKFTPARRAALQRAAEISARKRRKNKVQPAKKGLSSNQKKAVVLGGAAVAVGAGLAYAKYSNGKTSKSFAAELDKIIAEEKAKTPEQKANDQKQFDLEKATQADLIKAAGNTSRPAESQEEWDARVKLFGKDGVLGEYSAIHNGRAEIFPTLPIQEVTMVYARETAFPSMTIRDLPEDKDGYITLYHRTGGGDDLDGQKAKESLLKDQKFKILNRDEKRVAAINPIAKSTVNNKLVWMSNKLNDSNTRAAFGETVVKVRVYKPALEAADPSSFGTQSFGELSPGEVWAAIDPRLLKDAIIEDVPDSDIKPAPERKFRAPR